MTAKSMKAAMICTAGLLAFTGTIRMTNAAPISEYDKYVFSIAEDYVNIREDASEESTVIGKLYSDSIGEIVEQQGEWYRISSGDLQGYVRGDYVVTGEAAKEVAQEAKNNYAVVETEALYLREAPDQEAPVLDILGEGARYEVLSEEAQWVRVAAGGQEGYLHKEYIAQETAYQEAVSLAQEQLEAKSDIGRQMADYALTFVGNPYVWGGTSLTNGADCSGFVQTVHADFGYSIPRTSRAQAAGGTAVSEANMQPGDLLFYSSGGGINHVAMYIGEGQVVHASNAKNGIKVSDYNYRTPAKIVRYR